MGDLTKALPHVATGLIEKRREIAGLSEELQCRMRQAALDPDQVEASIRLFKPDIDLEEVMPRPAAPCGLQRRSDPDRSGHPYARP